MPATLPIWSRVFLRVGMAKRDDLDSPPQELRADRFRSEGQNGHGAPRWEARDCPVVARNNERPHTSSGQDQPLMQKPPIGALGPLAATEEHEVVRSEPRLMAAVGGPLPGA